MICKVKLDNGAFMPTRGHRDDAGWDLRTPLKLTVKPHGSVVVDTGVHFEIPKGYVGMIKSKSGLNVNKDLNTEGVIDAGYVGSIVVKIYNLGSKTAEFDVGDKITQLVVEPIADIDELVEVAFLEDTERGENGFGSTGK